MEIYKWFVFFCFLGLVGLLIWTTQHKNNESFANVPSPTKTVATTSSSTSNLPLSNYVDDPCLDQATVEDYKTCQDDQAIEDYMNEQRGTSGLP